MPPKEVIATIREQGRESLGTDVELRPEEWRLTEDGEGFRFERVHSTPITWGHVGVWIVMLVVVELVGR